MFIACTTAFALCGIVFVLLVLVEIASFIKRHVKAYRDRSNNCGDGAPEETGQGVVDDKEQDVTEGEDKDKESFA